MLHHPAAGEAAQHTATRTVTYLLTGVERVAALWEVAPEAAAAAIARQHELIDVAVRRHGGLGSGRIDAGDGVLAVFGSAAEAVAAALTIQLAFSAENWPDGLAVRARLALCTGEVRGLDGADHRGLAAHRCAQLRDLAHGGQTLLSSVTASLVADGLPDGSWLVDLGTHRLRDLSRPERVFELRHADLPGDFPPLRSLQVVPNNLPVQLTSFVGRSEELLSVQRLLTGNRLVTLAGAGGCGKTRLASQAAAELAGRWPDGVWWVDLGPVTDPALVAELTASTLRVLVEPAGGPLRALVSQLGGRQLLLYLDTCEHLLDACAELADTLLRGCPGVSVLATSREPLGVAGEIVWRVPPLVEDEAAWLFADRAALVHPGFAAQADHAPVRAICRRLDGIPLAIELAAAWVRALTPAQIAAGMDDRFRLLVGGARGAVARHRTLAASIDWSHDLLDEGDRVVFRRVAVFAGGFTLDAAHAVCATGEAGDVLAAIGRLVDKSLVVAQEHGGEVRYRLLDTIRQYALDRLREAGELAAVRDRHLDHFLAFVERAVPGLERDQDTWRAALAAEHDDLRAALEWGLAAEDPQRARRLAAALARFWFLHGHTHDALGFLTQAIALAPDDRSTLQGRLLSGLAMIGLGSGRPELTADAAARGLRIAVANGDRATRALCLALSAYGPFYRDFAAARELAVQAGQHPGDDLFADDFALLIEACTFTNSDLHDDAVRRARTVLERCLPRGERFCAVFARECEAYAALLTGDVRRADALATEAMRIAEPLRDYFTVGHAISNLAWVKSVAGEVDAGLRLMEPLVRSIEAAGPDVQIPLMALSPAKLHLAGGDPAGAVAWFERALRFDLPTTDNWVVARALPGLAGALRRLGRRDEAREQAERGIALARQLDTPHVLAEALEEAAFLAADTDPARAEDLHHEALAVRVAHGLRTFYVDSLEALAALTARAGRLGEAARVLAACDTARELIGYPRPAVNQPDHDATVAAVRSGLGDDGFADACAQGAALDLDDAVAYASRMRGPRGRPSTGWGSLTPTELRVTRLVLDGLTNPEIAARLFMSPATVKTHLSHIYAKLQVANRTELATLAATRPTEP